MLKDIFLVGFLKDRFCKKKETMNAMRISFILRCKSYSVRKCIILSIFVFPSFCSFSQQADYIHPTTLQLFFSIADFRNSSPFSDLSKGYGGLGVIFTKGITRKLDWSLATDFLYADSVMKKKTVLPAKELLIEADLSVRWRILRSTGFFQPFVNSGIGLSVIKNHFGQYFFAGTGLQFNVSREIFPVINIQRRFGLNTNLSNHYFYSIGLAGSIGKRRKKTKLKSAVTAIAKEIIPDRDKDGIVDSLDQCPDQPGIKEYQGCPDTDRDGLPDNRDKCPTVPGFAKYEGCPVPDTDKDGINDEEDQCPAVPGFVRYHGCPIPDTDKDGVNDDEDSCINQPGLKELHGCPQVKKEIKEAMDLAAKNIFFKTGSYELLSASYPALNEVARIMQDNPQLKLQIEGHTDSVGSAEANQKLSESRAKAILEYLVAKEITSARMNSIGYGEEKPIAHNKTAEGRARNRRVELKLSY